MPLLLAALALASPVAHGAPSKAVRPADAFGVCLKRSGSMLEEAQCYVTEQTRLEAEQKRLLDTLFARLKRPGPAGSDYPAAAAALAKAQAAWMTYQDTDCQIMDHVFGEGNAAGLAGGTCTMDHYTARNAVLRDLLSKYLAAR
jgi:uncharacterized protein YecT (DUF1311 family)